MEETSGLISDLKMKVEEKISGNQIKCDGCEKVLPTINDLETGGSPLHWLRILLLLRLQQTILDPLLFAESKNGRRESCKGGAAKGTNE